MPSSPLPSWADQMRALDGVVDELVATWRPGGASEAELQDMNRLALSMLAEGYLCKVYTDDKRPVFMPLWNYAMNQGGPDPDYVYSSVEIDPAGTYRISGFRGTSRFVADPWGTVERIYEFLDLELEPAVERAFRAWHAENRSGTHGAHHYSAEQFGLSDEQLRADFPFYTEHFDVELEA